MCSECGRHGREFRATIVLRITSRLVGGKISEYNGAAALANCEHDCARDESARYGMKHEHELTIDRQSTPTSRKHLSTRGDVSKELMVKASSN